jgi:uncharacterized repeat protein (TIGR03803 family)
MKRPIAVLLLSCAAPIAAGTSASVSAAPGLTVLYSFTGGADGANPSGSLIIDSAGSLYGTTVNGGVSGYDTVFKLRPNGTETVIYSFTGGADGFNAYSGLIADSAGNVYGTTIYGGASGNGAVYKVTPSGTETVLYSFTGGADGANPYAGLIADSAGNVYGAANSGGASGNGTVFKLTGTGFVTAGHGHH